jgi:hypothetical protein
MNSKILSKAFLLLMVLAVLASPSFAQTATTSTTLSAAMSGGANNNRMSLTSTTGVSASTTGAQQFCLIDMEIVQVVTVPSSGALTVRRATGGVGATPHNSGANVICGPGGGLFNVNTGGTSGVFLGTAHPTGACTASNSQYLPVVSMPSQGVFVLANCNNGLWQDQTYPIDAGVTFTRYCSPIGIQALSVINSPLLVNIGTINAAGFNTPGVSTQTWYGSIEIPKTLRLTGISLLNGTVGGTDKYVLGLYRSDGVLVANTATAGTTSGTLLQFNDIAFTSTYLATGPARYWIAVQANGGTTRFSTILVPNTTSGLGNFTGVLGSYLQGSTFGTLPPNLAAFTGSNQAATTTVATTLLNASAPVSCVY